MKRWFDDVKVGDSLVPDPCWSKTTPQPGRKLPDRCEVLEIFERRGQSGRAFSVKTMSGAKITLAAGWFLRRVES